MVSDAIWRRWYLYSSGTGLLQKLSTNIRKLSLWRRYIIRLSILPIWITAALTCFTTRWVCMIPLNLSASITSPPLPLQEPGRLWIRFRTGCSIFLRITTSSVLPVLLILVLLGGLSRNLVYRSSSTGLLLCYIARRSMASVVWRARVSAAWTDAPPSSITAQSRLCARLPKRALSSAASTPSCSLLHAQKAPSPRATPST